MANGNTVKEVKAMMPKVKEIFDRYAQMLKDRNVPIKDLVFTRQISKEGLCRFLGYVSVKLRKGTTFALQCIHPFK